MFTPFHTHICVYKRTQHQIELLLHSLDPYLPLNTSLDSHSHLCLQTHTTPDRALATFIGPILAVKHVIRLTLTFVFTNAHNTRYNATLGSNVGEHWLDPDALGTAIATVPGQGGTNGYHTEESCTQYNILKVVRHLFKWEPSAALGDDYEHKLTNGVLGIQKPGEPGTMVYMTPLGNGVTRVLSDGAGMGWGTPDDSFWVSDRSVCLSVCPVVRTCHSMLCLHVMLHSLTRRSMLCLHVMVHSLTRRSMLCLPSCTHSLSRSVIAPFDISRSPHVPPSHTHTHTHTHTHCSVAMALQSKAFPSSETRSFSTAMATAAALQAAAVRSGYAATPPFVNVALCQAHSLLYMRVEHMLPIIATRVVRLVHRASPPRTAPLMLVRSVNTHLRVYICARPPDCAVRECCAPLGFRWTHSHTVCRLWVWPGVWWGESLTLCQHLCRRPWCFSHSRRARCNNSNSNNNNSSNTVISSCDGPQSRAVAR
jgi:hypothetical protein